MSRKEKETDLEAIRQVAISMAYLDPKPVSEEGLSFFLSHPFTNSPIVPIPDTQTHAPNLVNIMKDASSLRKWQKFIAEAIDTSSLIQIYFMLDPRYQLTFFKHIRGYLSEQDFSELWRTIWTQSEGGNNFTVLTKRECLSYFRKSVPNILMEPEDYTTFKELPETVTVYRGVCPRQKKPIPSDEKNTNALSWTLSEDVAKYFATRYMTPSETRKGIIYKAHIEKSHILAYFEDRNEKEIILDPKYLRGVSKRTA